MTLAVAAIIATMRERGIAEPDILAVVEAAVSGEKRSAGAIRQARYRAKKNAQTVTNDVTSDVTSNVTEPAPFPPRDINSTPLTPPVSELRSESRAKRVRTLASDDFETGFWKPYPTTPPMSKAEAWKAWQKLGPEEREAVKSSVSDFVAYCRSHPDYPVVHACRYITKRKFEGFLPQANVVAFASTRVFVEEGTPQWQAWKTRRLAQTGRPLNASDFLVSGVRKMGFYFESEWPPDATVTSSPPLPKPDEASASSCSASEREGQGRQATEARFAYSR